MEKIKIFTEDVCRCIFNEQQFELFEKYNLFGLDIKKVQKEMIGNFLNIKTLINDYFFDKDWEIIKIKDELVIRSRTDNKVRDKVVFNLKTGKKKKYETADGFWLRFIYTDDNKCRAVSSDGQEFNFYKPTTKVNLDKYRSQIINDTLYIYDVYGNEVLLIPIR
jgi:hypothetical protein